MARINIEDCWWTDPRRSKLAKLVGDEVLADGIAIRAWRVAQEFWGNGGLIPLKIWETIEANVNLIEAKLAEVRDGGIYVCGSSQYLDWVRERREAARIGGIKSAATRKNKAPKVPKKKANVEANAKQTQPSGSISYSGSSSDSNSSSISEVVPADLKILNSEIWEAYREAYASRYNTEPIRNAKVNSMVSQLGRRLGGEAAAVVRFYLTHNKSFYVSKLHDFGLCLADAEALRTQWFHDKAITERDVKRFAEGQERSELYDAIQKGEI